MRRHLLLMLSVGLNVVLAMFLLLPGNPQNSGPTGATVLAQASAPTNKNRTQVVVRKQYFSWNEVESSDYPAYIAGLRSIGCPEQTIRDIVVADVNELYARKRMSEVVTPDQQWWRADPDTNVMAAANAKLQALDQERRTLLATLLGPNWETTDLSRSVVPLNGPVLGDLPPDVKDKVQQILARIQQRIQAYAASQQALGRQPDPAELARIGQQMRAELGQVLTPAQLEEFLLRYSESARDLREQLRGFAVTPDEFRKIFRLSDPLAQQIHLLNPDDPTTAGRLQGLQKQFTDAVQSVLGPDRYQAYMLAQDPAYRDAVALGQQAGVSSNVVQKLYKVNQAGNAEADRIRNDPTLTADQKAEQLKAIGDAQTTATDLLLGVNPPAPTNAPPTTPPPPPPAAIHAYLPGETIDQVAAQYGVSTEAILKANPDVDFNHLPRGANIKIPPK